MKLNKNIGISKILYPATFAPATHACEISKAYTIKQV